MRIRTKYTSRSNSNVGKIVATGMGKQKSTTMDQSKSLDANHGIAAANLIIHVQATSPELQYGDNIVSNAVRSIDAGASTHEAIDSTIHVFNI